MRFAFYSPAEPQWNNNVVLCRRSFSRIRDEEEKNGVAGLCDREICPFILRVYCMDRRRRKFVQRRVSDNTVFWNLWRAITKGFH